MFKAEFGPITNPKTGRSKVIAVSSLNRKNIRDFLIGTTIAVVGVAYAAVSAFKNGAVAYDEEGIKTMYSLGLVVENEDLPNE